MTEFETDMVYVIERALSNHGHSVAGSINTMATPSGALDIDVLPFMQAVTSDILGIVSEISIWEFALVCFPFSHF